MRAAGSPGERRAGGVGAALGVVVALGLAAAAAHYATLRFGVPPAAAGIVEERLPIVPSAGGPPEPLAALPDAPVRNVILLVGDGMGGSQVVAGRLQTRGADGRFTMERFPVVGLVATHPWGGPVTKSDAAATALATGVKTSNGRIGEDAAGRRLPTILETLRDAGWATALLTTSRITDATPGSFAAHVAARPMQAEIADQLAVSRIDLLAGGGREFFVPGSTKGSKRGDDRDLLAVMRSNGVTVVEDPAAFASATTLPLAAIFDREPQKAGPSPTVGALAEKALALLAADGRPFFALIEDEECDTASHEGDGRRLAAALERFDAAVAAAVDFARRDGHTLVLVTGDHATGGPTIDERSTEGELVLVWESSHHTGEPIPIYAFGPAGAAARFGGMIDNTDIPRQIAAIVGVDFARATESAR